MGGCTSKQERSVKESSTEQSRGRRHMRREMDEREKVMFGQLREAERVWRKERKKLREEVKRLRKKVEERDEAKTTTTTTTEEREYWKWVVEQMCVERAVRDEAVEKWKQLYLAIKNELDHLIIHTTSSGEAITQSKLAEEEEAIKSMEELRDELRVKEEIIETLKEKVALMDRQKYEKEREIDLLRQSMRILGSKKKKKKGASFASMNLLVLKTKCV